MKYILHGGPLNRDFGSLHNSLIQHTLNNKELYFGVKNHNTASYILDQRVGNVLHLTFVGMK